MRSEAITLAQIQSRTKLQSQALGLLADPLWSSILGFVAVHELRKHDLIGPIGDDLLYGGIIAVNTTRAGITREVREGSVGLAQAGADALKSLTNLGTTALGSIGIGA